MRIVQAFVLVLLVCCGFHLSNGQLLSSLMDFVYRGQRNAAIEDLDEAKDGSRVQFVNTIECRSSVQFVINFE